MKTLKIIRRNGYVGNSLVYDILPIEKETASVWTVRNRHGNEMKFRKSTGKQIPMIDEHYYLHAREIQ